MTDNEILIKGSTLEFRVQDTYVSLNTSSVGGITSGKTNKSVRPFSTKTKKLLVLMCFPKKKVYQGQCNLLLLRLVYFFSEQTVHNYIRNSRVGLRKDKLPVARPWITLSTYGTVVQAF